MSRNPQSHSDYLNFDLLITRAGDQYRAYVIDAPGGNADATFTVPFSPQEIGRLSRGAGTRRHLRPSEESVSPSPSNLRELGSRLYDVVFRDAVRSVLVASQAEAQAEGRALRIRLRFSDDAVDLATLPWEILFDPEQQHFLALSEARPILRYLSLPRSRPPLKVEPPLTILAVLASPAGHTRLEVEQEWQAIETALATLCAGGKVTLERLAMPTFDALRNRLLGDPVHVLHFVGHGIYDAVRGEGALLLEDARRQGHLIPAKSLAMLLHNHSSLRLVYLNACEGAIAAEGNVFAGVAQTLVQQGVPAAVAMQDEITDAAAIETARTFYTALATGRPVDAALTQARVALAAQANDEWAIPVLFSRSPDNRLFDLVDVLPTPDCPYPGMRPFSEEQQKLFFGRDREIDEAVNRLAQHPFLTVVGPSGSGKSSLVYAGIIPALRQSRRFGSGDWDVKIMRPSDSRTSDGKAAPMAAMASLLDGTDIFKMPVPLKSNTLLFIDQFEEVFTLTGAGEAAQFLNALHTFIKTPNLHILFTVRADFYPEMMAMGPLWEAVKDNRLELTPLGDDELWAAIVQPAAAVGVTVDEALVVALIQDAAGEAGVLPLVQETLVLLWEKVISRQLKLKAYQAMADGGRSGIQVAIDRRANVVYNNLPAATKPIARRIFLRLIQFGNGRADTRRQQTVAELRASGDDPVRFDETLRTLVDSRLLTTSGEEGDPNRRVDISHEALIGGWALLQQWIGEKRVAESTRRRLEGAAQTWIDTGKQGGLLDDFELHEAKAWLALADAEELGVSQHLMDLVEVSRCTIEEREAEKEAIRRRELEQQRKLTEEQRLRAEEQETAASSLRRRALMLTGVGLLAVVLAVAAVFFGIDSGRNAQNARNQEAAAVASANEAQTQEATAKAEAIRANEQEQYAIYQAQLAEAEALRARQAESAAQAQARHTHANALTIHAQSRMRELGQTDDIALILARDAVATTWYSDTFVSRYSLTTLINAIRGHHISQHLNWGRPHDRHTSAKFSHDDTQIVTGSSDGTAIIWDRENVQPILTFQGHIREVNDVDFSHDDTQIVTGSSDGTAIIWDAKNGQPITTLYGHRGFVLSTAFNHDSSLVVTSGQDKSAIIWNAKNGQLLVRLEGHTSWVTSAAFNHNSTQVVTVSQYDPAIIWDAITGQPVTTLQSEGGFIYSAGFNHDGTLVVTAGQNPDVIIWGVQSGQPIVTIDKYGWASSAAFNFTGSQIVFTNNKDEIVIWDLESNQSVIEIQEGRCDENSFCRLRSASFNHRGTQIVTAGTDEATTIWNIESGQPVSLFQGHVGSIESADFNHDGTQVVTAGEDKNAIIWDVQRGQPVVTLRGHTARLRFVSFNHDGTQVVTASDDGTAIVWDTQSGQPATIMKSHFGPLSTANFNHDGSQLIAASTDGSIIWDIGSGEAITSFDKHKNVINSAVFNYDSTRALTASADETAIIWDVKTGEIITILEGHEDAVMLAIFNHDSTRALTASADETAIIWDVETGEPLIIFRGHEGAVNSAKFNHDETRIITASADGTATIWDANDGKAIITLRGHKGSVYSANFNHDSTRVVSASSDATAIIWGLEVTDPLTILSVNQYSGLSANFNHDGTRVAATDSVGAKIWDAENGQLLTTLQGHTRGIASIAFNHTGTQVVTASYDDTAIIWDVESGQPQITLEGHGSIDTCNNCPCFKVGNCPVTSAKFNHDGTQIITASQDHTAIIWDATTGQPLLTLRGHNGYVWHADFNHNGQQIVTASADNTAIIWNAESGQPIATLQGHQADVLSATFNHDGTQIVTASIDRTAIIWNVNSGQPAVVLRGHQDHVNFATFNHDGKYVVTVSRDKTGIVWDVKSGVPIIYLEGHEENINSAAFNHDSTQIVTSSSDGNVIIWPMPQLLIEISTEKIARYMKELTSIERQEYNYLAAEVNRLEPTATPISPSPLATPTPVSASPLATPP